MYRIHFQVYVQRDRDLDFDPDPDADRERRSRGLLGLRERDLKDKNTVKSVHFLSMKPIIHSNVSVPHLC